MKELILSDQKWKYAEFKVSMFHKRCFHKEVLDSPSNVSSSVFLYFFLYLFYFDKKYWNIWYPNIWLDVFVRYASFVLQWKIPNEIFMSSVSSLHTPV